MASRQNLNNRTNAFKPTGKRGILGKVYGALGKEFKNRRAQPTVTEQQPEVVAGESRERGGFRGITMGIISSHRNSHHMISHKISRRTKYHGHD